MEIQNSKNAGFSLIELIFAMSFLTIIIFGVISLQSSNLAMLSSQNNEIQAHFYANQGIQILKAIGQGGVKCDIDPNEQCRIKRNSGNPDSYSIEKNTDENIDNLSLYYRDFTWNSDSLTNAVLATVTVDWEDSTGNHSVSAKQIIQ